MHDHAWPINDIDRFILARLEAEGLSPVRDADKLALIRRVTFDLTGLPPTPEEIEAFVADRSPDAFERVVDRLLASPAYGERWGRHWLDVARYGESTGSSRNLPLPHAWRYRDYVIDAFNRDKPYDQFIREQIAGDLLPSGSERERVEHLIATGFLALGVKDVNQRFKVRFIMDNVDEQIDAVSRAVLGLTASCARCHDHKFDPIPTADYYALAGHLPQHRPVRRPAEQDGRWRPGLLRHPDVDPLGAETSTRPRCGRKDREGQQGRGAGEGRVRAAARQPRRRQARSRRPAETSDRSPEVQPAPESNFSR